MGAAGGPFFAPLGAGGAVYIQKENILKQNG